MARGYHRDLIAWKKSMELVKMLYPVTGIFPKHELYGLTSQLRRALISVPSNIAEGNERNSDKQFIHFLEISKGSLMEVDTQLELAHSFGYIQGSNEITFNQSRKLINEIRAILNGLISGLRR